MEGIVHAAINGIKACIFAYGQTGSGKVSYILSICDSSTTVIVNFDYFCTIYIYIMLPY